MSVRRRRTIKYLGNVKSGVETATGLQLQIDGGSATVTVYSPEIVRVDISVDGVDRGPDISYAATMPAPKKSKFKISSDDHEWRIDTGPLNVVVCRYPFRVKFFDRSQRRLSMDSPWGAAGSRNGKIYSDRTITSGEHFYGFGEKAFTMDRRGKKMEMWTTEAAAHQWNSDPLYVSIPFLIGLHSGAAYGILYDSPWRATFEMGGSGKRYYTYSADGGGVNYYFLAGPDMKDVMSRYADLTGHAEIPPLWALGFHQSRWSYKTEAKVRYIAEHFRELQIPCDVIHLDIHYMRGYRIFTWDEKVFPDPRTMISDLAGNGFRIVPIVDPGVKIDKQFPLYNECLEKDYFCRKKNGALFEGVVWPGRTNFPDFARDDVRDWWAERVAEFKREHGHAGQWNDMNEPSVNITPHLRMISTESLCHTEQGERVPHSKLRNVYGQLEAEATHRGLLAAAPAERPFILSRSGFAGIHRYSAIWSGDNTSSWAHMHLSIPLLCSLGMSGVPFVGADIGGFMGNCTAELFGRWIQLGSFYPFSRAHTMMMTTPQQPWSFGDEVTAISKKYISLRYRLLPYIYNCFYQAAKRGTPVMRAMAFEFQNDLPCAAIDDQFMFGDSILVAPVLKSGMKKRDVYFPQAGWIDFHTGARMPNNGVASVPTPFKDMPLYIRAGKIIPMWPLMQHTEEKPRNPLILNVYCGKDSSLEFYEDDYKSYPAGRKHLLTKFEHKDSPTDMELSGSPISEKGAGNFTPERTHISALFHNYTQRPRWVVLNGKPLKESWSADAFGDAPHSGWAWDQDRGILAVGFKNNGAAFNLTISV